MPTSYREPGKPPCALMIGQSVIVAIWSVANVIAPAGVTEVPSSQLAGGGPG